MQLFFYNIFLALYTFSIRVTALFNKKAKQWLAGRKNILRIAKERLADNKEQRIWVHCSSLGEFEQGRPLIEAIKKQYPAYKIVLTFFSPSGYEVRKDYKYADYIFYLPMDGRKTAEEFIGMVNPKLAIFVKYEFWHYYLDQLRTRNIPTVLVSAAFRPSQAFFKWHGGLFRNMLQCFTLIFVQDVESKRLLQTIGIDDNVLLSGDTRYDRVSEIAEIAKKFPLIEKFKGKDCLLIAGSTWPDDEKLLKKILPTLPDDWGLIIAPHEINSNHIEYLQNLFESHCVLYSELSTEPKGFRVLIIDNIGMLSSLYSYGEIAYIGGGFQKGGIHNVLEPAVFGLPVFFGPRYDKFIEAKALVSHQFAFPVSNVTEFNNLLQQLIHDEIHLKALQKSIRAYVSSQVGAADKIMQELSARWLR